MFSCLAASPKKKSSKKTQSLSGQQVVPQSPQLGSATASASASPNPASASGNPAKISTRKLLARLLPPPAPQPAAAADGQLHALLKHLNHIGGGSGGGDRLARLALAVEVGVTGSSECVRLEPGGPETTELQLGRHRLNARTLCLRAWRFPDLADGEPLAPLTDACCSRQAGQCVNPFHFYRTVAAAPDLQCLIDRLGQLELKLPLAVLSDNEVSSSGCSSDSLLSGRKSWLTTASASSASAGGGSGGSCSCSCCSCCSAAACSSVSAGGGGVSFSGSMCSARHQYLGGSQAFRRLDQLGGDLEATRAEEGGGCGGGGEGEDSTWCALAYWEGRSRVGQLVRVSDTTFNVFHRRPLSNGLSLEALATGPSGRGGFGGADPDGELARQAAKTRTKIGAGVTLVRRRWHRRHRHNPGDEDELRHCGEGDGWRTELLIFNQSEHAVFVHSPTLQPLMADAPYQAVKLPPHSCLKAFDSAAASLLCRARQLGPPTSQCAAADPFTVRLSFVKGFGAAYQRQDIIYCPCWLEVMLSVTS